MSDRIIEKMFSTGEILRRVAKDPVEGNSMLYNGVDESTHVGSLFGGIVTYWGAEGGTLTSSKPKWYQLELKLKKVHALCYATDEQLEDTRNLSSWLGRNVPKALTFAAEDAIIEGDGVGKPYGILSAPATIAVLREDANTIKLSDINNMWSRRWLGGQGYVWLVNQTAAAQLGGMTASTAPVYLPNGTIASAPYGTLKGAPVIETEYCQALGTTGDLMLVSLENYQAIDKPEGISSTSSIHVAFTTDEVAFKFTYRIAGAPSWNSAVTPLHGSTVSPFVVLSSASA
jgi:HK97 family phage major capsid protein